MPGGKELFFKKLKEINGMSLLRDEPATNHSTYRAGGRFEFMAQPRNEAELSLLLRIAAECNEPVHILGRGSNILVSDRGLPGLAVSVALMDKIEILHNCYENHDYSEVKAGGGALLDSFVMLCCKSGLAGCEKLSGIPGSIGGAIRMNAGAYGQETADCLESFNVMFSDGKIIEIAKYETEFSYRHSGFPKNCVVLSAKFRLRRADPEVLMGIRQETLASRRKKQPLEYPSAGSVFRRPPGDYASRLIDICGLKGMTAGGAQVSEKHAGFIINRGNASASEIYELIQKVKKAVKEQTGTDLQLEQVLWGEF